MSLSLSPQPPRLSPARGLRVAQGHRANPAEFLAFIVAYMELLLARWECIDHGGHPRDKAVPRSKFHQLGIQDFILLWMLFHDHVEHLKFVPRSPCSRSRKTSDRLKSHDFSYTAGPAKMGHRPLCPSGKTNLRCKPAMSLTLTDESCLALNDKGAAFVDAFLAEALLPQFEGAFEDAWSQLIIGLLTPSYDQEQRIFTWGEHLLKRFRQPAVNQELVLISAEELDWPEWFDDPLPRRNGHNPKTLLDTIKDLNRRQAEWLVHFKGDGSGRRIGWELK